MIISDFYKDLRNMLKEIVERLKKEGGNENKVQKMQSLLSDNDE